MLKKVLLAVALVLSFLSAIGVAGHCAAAVVQSVPLGELGPRFLPGIGE